jgi:hypothetical protein
VARDEKMESPRSVDRGRGNSVASELSLFVLSCFLASKEAMNI